MTDATPRLFKSGRAPADAARVRPTAPHHRPPTAPRAPSSGRRLRALGLALCAALVIGGWAVAVPSASADTAFTFTGGGWGHGVGMSQWGARGMAAQGSSATDILTHYYSGASVGPVGVSDDLRVLLGVSGSFTLTAGGPTSFSQFGGAPVGYTNTGGVVTVGRSGNSITMNGSVVSSVDGALLVGYGGGPLRVSPPGNRYAYGSLLILPDAGGGLRAIIVGLGMQQYLYGLGEMPSSWPAEALKAQAIAGRTYAQKLASKASRWSSDFDIHGGLPDQTYLGWEKEAGAMGAQWRAAVDATNGVAVTYGGGLIDAVYSASSGGYTENSETVWVSALPYLRGVPDPADLTGGNPNASWARTYTGSQLGAWFGIGVVSSVQILGPLGVSGRVDKATIRLVGSGGTKDVNGVAFRSWVNGASPGAQLLSTKFSVGGSAPAPPPASDQPPFGLLDVARADGRTVIVAGRALDADGTAPTVRIVSTLGTQVATRDVQPINGQYLAAWTGAPGTRTVCVSLIDNPTGQVVSLGCRSVVVK
jgi:SpoIID/LytB domain protein